MYDTRFSYGGLGRNTYVEVSTILSVCTVCTSEYRRFNRTLRVNLFSNLQCQALLLILIVEILLSASTGCSIFISAVLWMNW